MTTTSNRFQLQPVERNGYGADSANGNGNGNGNGNSNGNGGNGDIPSGYVPQSFDKPVILKQSPRWAQLITVTIMGVTVAALVAAFVIKVDEAISASGKLEPQGEVQVIQAPVGGVVEKVLVKEGEQVEQGQVVAMLDETATKAQIESNQEISQRLNAENNYYRAQLSGVVDAVAPSGVAADLIQRGRDRTELVATNRLYQAQIGGNAENLDANQVDRLETAQSRLNSQQRINTLQTDQYREQLNKTREQLNNSQTEVNTLQQDIDRLNFQISQGQQEVSRTAFESRETFQDRISVNEQNIAEIDSQITQRILENDRQLSELSSQLAQFKQSVKYQALTAPVSGTVFNLKANQPGYVANSTEPMMEIVPEDDLIARVFIPSKDVGFIKIGQKVDVRIDAYSFSEFGDMEGTVTAISTDALPPNELYNFYHIPAEITLEQQQFVVDDVPLAIRSGMSLSANIKLRKRRVITFFTDLFTRKVDAVTTGN
ncbi:MAG: hemolysin D [Phormidesmis priestleyi]|uniref:Hemolysin D n=1 Tax=Phormidesmis priestleyi TaxID=268141 RepID=A0A2W4Y0M2_9CYAN|nr:MAG: hemolysin D [Phormidesmis priestleyi]